MITREQAARQDREGFIPHRHDDAAKAILARVLIDQRERGGPVPAIDFRESLPSEEDVHRLDGLKVPAYLESVGAGLWVTLRGLLILPHHFVEHDLEDCRLMLVELNNLRRELRGARCAYARVEQRLGWSPQRTRRVLRWLSDHYLGSRSAIDGWIPDQFDILEQVRWLQSIRESRQRLFPGHYEVLATRPETTMTDYSKDVDIGILTIREDEFRAVLEAFPGDRHEVRLTRHYNVVDVEDDTSGYRVAILRQIEQGNGEAQSVARDLIDDLAPTLILVVGIAGGLPSDDFSLGDVVLATRIHDFSVAKRSDGDPATYSQSGGPITKDIQNSVANLAAVEHLLGNWTGNLPTRPTVDVDQAKVRGSKRWRDDVVKSLRRHFGVQRAPVVVAGPMASSDLLIKDPAILFPWIETSRHLISVEMESAGVYRAARERVSMLPIRGISDIVGLQREEAWTKYACRSAAAFARAYLRTRPVKSKRSALTSIGPPAVPAASTLAPPGLPLFFGAQAARLSGEVGTREKGQPQRVAWSLRVTPDVAARLTKGDLNRGLEASLLTIVMGNYERSMRWPRVVSMTDAESISTSPSTLSWVYGHALQGNVVEEESLIAWDSGSIEFRRAKCWWVPNALLDMGAIALDLTWLIEYARRFANHTKSLSDLTIDVEVTLDSRGPTTAMFGSAGVQSTNPISSATSTKRTISGHEKGTVGGLASNDFLSDVVTRLIDRIANEFALSNDDPFRGTSRFISVDPSSIADLVRRVPRE